MNRLIILPLFLLFLCCNVLAQNKAANNYALNIRVPSTWIEKVRKYNYKENNAALLKELESIIKPYVIYVPDYQKNLDKTKPGLLNPIFMDLDGEAGEELLCTVAWDETHPSMTVFKKMKDGWHLLYMEDYYMFYTMPDMYVANNYSRNKTFYFRRVHERGSGVYADGYSFFKLINGKVYHCLELLRESHIYGWGLYLNQQVTTNIKFSGSEQDGESIWVSYNYNFFPGEIQDGDCPWCPNEDSPLVKGKNAVSYDWDKKSNSYKLDIPTYKYYDGLTAAQIACFYSFGNDEAFIAAYRTQIDKTLKEGTAQQKQLLRKYLDKVNSKKKPAKKLEKKANVGGTNFYGPKKQ